MKEDINYQEIAEKTGVSISTISRILTGSARVAEATSARVFEFFEKNNYDITFLRSKKARSGGIIIFNVPSMINPFYSPICGGARAAAQTYGYNLLINEEHITGNTIDNLINLIKRTRAAGLIITNSVPALLLKKLAAAVPLVQCCEYDETIPLPYVSIDDIAASKIIMDYLFAHGKKNIVLMNGPIRYKYARHRLQGYQEALARAGIPADPSLVFQLPEVSYDMAVSEATRFLRRGGRPDAFFCVSDVYAAAVVKAGKRLGFSIPGDFIVVGFDNVEIASMTHPALTTINQPKHQLGVSSCELLVERINNPQAPVRSILLETELIVRESSAERPE
ncbi:DNA-binding transcriptional regulator CytR [Spirochaetia bacterium]|nr:DNA-binding transcriptional regulator CytR [Spirochaetia bacterium]